MKDDLFEIEGEILLEDDSEMLIEDTPDNNDGELLISDDEETFFSLDPVYDSNDLVENTDIGNSETNQQINNEVFNLQNDLEDLSYNALEVENVGENDESSNDDEILESMQIIQRNVKTGFDNLSLIGSVQTGLISFGIGAIIIYCYIGRFK